MSSTLMRARVVVRARALQPPREFRALRALQVLLVLLPLVSGGLGGVSVAGLRAQGKAEIEHDVQELRQYRLTMEKVRQMTAASLAYAQAMERNPKVKAQRDADAASHADEGDPKTLSDMARRIEREPELAAAIRGVGLSTREFSLITLTFYNAMFAHDMKKAGTIAEMPKDILPENAAFIASNEAELRRMLAQLEAYDGR